MAISWVLVSNVLFYGADGDAQVFGPGGRPLRVTA